MFDLTRLLVKLFHPDDTLVAFLFLERKKFVLFEIETVNYHRKLEVTITQTLQLLGVQIDTHDILIEYADIGNLLCRLGVHLVDILDEFDGTKDVLKVEAAAESREVLARIPHLLFIWLLVEEGLDFLL